MLIPTIVSMVCWCQFQCQWYVDQIPSLLGMLFPNLVSMVCQCSASAEGVPIPATVSIVCQSQPQTKWYANPGPSLNRMLKILTLVLMVHLCQQMHTMTKMAKIRQGLANMLWQSKGFPLKVAISATMANIRQSLKKFKWTYPPMVCQSQP